MKTTEPEFASADIAGAEPVGQADGSASYPAPEPSLAAAERGASAEDHPADPFYYWVLSRL